LFFKDLMNKIIIQIRQVLNKLNPRRAFSNWIDNKIQERAYNSSELWDKIQADIQYHLENIEIETEQDVIRVIDENSYDEYDIKQIAEEATESVLECHFDDHFDKSIESALTEDNPRFKDAVEECIEASNITQLALDQIDEKIKSELLEIIARDYDVNIQRKLR